MDKIRIIAALLALLFSVSASAQQPPYGQTIGSLPTLNSLTGAALAPIVQGGVDYKVPISQLTAFLGAGPAAPPNSIQFNNGGIFGGSSVFTFDPIAQAVGIGTPTIRAGATIDAGAKSDSFLLPGGTTAQRPSPPLPGEIRYNSQIGSVEAFFGGAWNILGVTAGVLPIVNGGTGLSTVGANGTVLTSNGASLSYQAFSSVLPSGGLAFQCLRKNSDNSAVIWGNCLGSANTTSPGGAGIVTQVGLNLTTQSGLNIIPHP